MPYNYSRLPHAGIRSLIPYAPGKSIEELAEEKGLTNIIKLASNENPLGCSPLVTKALAALNPHQIAAYPIAAHHPLRKKLAKKLGIDLEMLTLTNGSEGLIPLVQTCFALHLDKHILIPKYSFTAYAIHAQSLGIPVITPPVLPNWQTDIDALIAHANEKTALIFLANPNNPTGSFIDESEIKRLLQNIPESTILVLDEAYYEFVKDEDKCRTLELLKNHPNLIITRTFSKVYGLAGLRLGYGIANTEITSILQRALAPFPVTVATLIAGEAALEDQEFIQQSITNNQRGLAQIHQGLSALNISYLPSSGNFITFDWGSDAMPLYQNLLQRGIILRPLHPYGLNNYLRLTIGTEKQNARFLANLKEIQHEK